MIENASFTKTNIEFLTKKAESDYHTITKKLDSIKYDGMVLDARNDVAEKWNAFSEPINGDEGLLA